jgi:dienelactone hydrolase
VTATCRSVVLHVFAARVFAPLFVFAATAVAQADVVEPKSGAPIKAALWETEGDDVVFNVYRTKIRRVVRGVERLPKKSVKRTLEDPDPHRSFWRRFDALQSAGTAVEWLALAADAKTAKLRGLSKRAAFEALVKDPSSAEAQKELGSEATALKAADFRTNPQLKTAAEALFKEEDLAARLKAADDLRKLGFLGDAAYLERARRSSLEKRGRTEDRPLTLRSKEHKGVYTLFVPQSYDPLTPTPLVVGLHGGGRGGKDGKAVVGSGASAMNFYERGASALGWIVVCPTAVEAPWSAKPNDGFLKAVIEEVQLLFNVDLNRVYLTGHSMGGFGTWHFGPLYASRWAAIAPMAGGGAGGLQRLKETLTGVYLHHGADDPVVGVDSDRAAAEQMRKADMDFVYAEIPDSGHGFPPEVEAEMWEFFKPRRLAEGEGGGDRGRFTTTETTRSSFVGKPTKDEEDAFGPLLKAEAAASGAAELKRLLDDLRNGGGRAEKAVLSLGERKDAATANAVAKVVADTKAGADARRAACAALAAAGRKEGAKAVAAALSDDDLSVVGAAASAYGRLDANDKPKVYGRAVDHLLKRFSDKKSGDAMDYSDFSSFIDVGERLCDGAAASKDAACAAPLARAVETLLFDPVRVASVARAGQDAAGERRRLARAALAAFGELKGDDAAAAAAKIRARPEYSNLGL